MMSKVINQTNSRPIYEVNVNDSITYSGICHAQELGSLFKAAYVEEPTTNSAEHKTIDRMVGISIIMYITRLCLRHNFLFVITFYRRECLLNSPLLGTPTVILLNQSYGMQWRKDHLPHTNV